MKPSKVLKKWDKDVDALKKKITKECVKKDIKGREKSLKISKACSRLAKQTAKLAKMKSMGEVRCAADMEERGIPYSYETTVLSYQYKPQKYTPDFDIYTGDKKVIIEYKGKLDYDTRKKLLAVKECNPDVEVYLVFEKGNNKIRKGSKTTYMDWAKSKGFKSSERTINSEWLI
jgi:hypothetical protein